MALTKVISFDSIEVKANGILVVTEKTQILENGNLVGIPTYKRTTVTPSQVMPDFGYSLIDDVAFAVRTPALIAAYEAAQGQ